MSIASFIIGSITIPIMIIIPTIPVAFFSIVLQPITVSTASPNIFPTTGIKLDTAAFAVLAVTASTLPLKLPSTEVSPTNIVSTTPNTHTTLLLKNFDSLSICTLSDIFDTIPSEVDISTIGIITFVTKFPMNVITNNRMPCIKFADTTCPVVIINVINIGTNKFMKFTKFCIDSFIMSNICTKFVIINVTISMYCT